MADLTEHAHAVHALEDLALRSWEDLSDEEVVQLWHHAKLLEQQSKQLRQDIEDYLLARYAIDCTVAKRHTIADALTIECKLSYKVDSETIQELAGEHDLSAHLPTLCRWKPELNMRAWKATHASIRDALAPAITIKPARPTFSLIKPKQEN